MSLIENLFLLSFQYSAIAQSVERFPVKEDVPGSSPGRGARVDIFIIY